MLADSPRFSRAWLAWPERAALRFCAARHSPQSGRLQPPPWRHIGPEGNRISAVACVRVGRSSTTPARHGGIHKSIDGITWDPIFDGPPVHSIGDIAAAPSDPSTVWVGTGEACIRSHISVGEGIYKSTDAGRTWARMGLEQTGRIGKVIVHPKNPDLVRVCSRSCVWPATRARRISDHRWRKELGACALRGREHWVLGARHGSGQSQEALRGNVADRYQDLGSRERRAGSGLFHIR